MADAKALIEEIKRELHGVEQEIRNHAYLQALEAGAVRREDLRLFAGEQCHIIPSDLRSVALLVNRFGATPSGPFFYGVLAGEAAALDAVTIFADAVGLDEAHRQAYEPTPGALAYSAYMAWLALYGSAALRSRYGLAADSTKFFDLFAAAPADFERHAASVVDGGLARGVEPRLVKRAARLLQGYEKLYWDTLYALSGR